MQFWTTRNRLEPTAETDGRRSYNRRQLEPRALRSAILILIIIKKKKKGEDAFFYLLTKIFVDVNNKRAAF